MKIVSTRVSDCSSYCVTQWIPSSIPGWTHNISMINIDFCSNFGYSSLCVCVFPRYRRDLVQKMLHYFLCVCEVFWFFIQAYEIRTKLSKTILIVFQGSPLFAIRQRRVSTENTEGTIFLVGPLDFEAQSMYHLTLLAVVSNSNHLVPLCSTLRNVSL